MEATARLAARIIADADTKSGDTSAVARKIAGWAGSGRQRWEALWAACSQDQRQLLRVGAIKERCHETVMALDRDGADATGRPAGMWSACADEVQGPKAHALVPVLEWAEWAEGSAGCATARRDAYLRAHRDAALKPRGRLLEVLCESVQGSANARDNHDLWESLLRYGVGAQCVATLAEDDEERAAHGVGQAVVMQSGWSDSIDHDDPCAARRARELIIELTALWTRHRRAGTPEDILSELGEMCAMLAKAAALSSKGRSAEQSRLRIALSARSMRRVAISHGLCTGIRATGQTRDGITTLISTLHVELGTVEQSLLSLALELAIEPVYWCSPAMIRDAHTQRTIIAAAAGALERQPESIGQLAGKMLRRRFAESAPSDASGARAEADVVSKNLTPGSWAETVRIGDAMAPIIAGAAIAGGWPWTQLNPAVQDRVLARTWSERHPERVAEALDAASGAQEREALVRKLAQLTSMSAQSAAVLLAHRVATECPAEVLRIAAGAAPKQNRDSAWEALRGWREATNQQQRKSAIEEAIRGCFATNPRAGELSGHQVRTITHLATWAREEGDEETTIEAMLRASVVWNEGNAQTQWACAQALIPH